MHGSHVLRLIFHFMREYRTNVGTQTLDLPCHKIRLRQEAVAYIYIWSALVDNFRASLVRKEFHSNLTLFLRIFFSYGFSIGSLEPVTFF